MSSKRKLVKVGKYVPVRLSDNEEIAIQELAAKLEERKTDKLHLSTYPPEIITKVKAALICSIPMEEIKRRYHAPTKLIMHLQKKYNPKLRKTYHFKMVDKLYYGNQMINEGRSVEEIAKFLDFSVKGWRCIWDGKMMDIPTRPSKGMPDHWKNLSRDKPSPQRH